MTLAALIVAIWSTAGAGIPLLCLHTAGADSRQYRHLFNDAWVTSRCRVVAFDMPYHGRSNPPDRWWLHRYMLTTADYVGLIRAVWKALGLSNTSGAVILSPSI